MKTPAILHSAETARATTEAPAYPPLELVTSPRLDTASTAYYLNRRPQTVRDWACNETWPKALGAPIRINGRLAWPVDGIRRVLGIA